MNTPPDWLRAPVRWLSAVWSRPWIGFAIVFAWALWQRWNMPWLPLATADSWGFLGPALYELAGEGFRQTHGRSIAYPLFLLGILRFTESFQAIAMVQHIAGLLSGVAWVWVFALWVAWLPDAMRRCPFVWWIGAFALGLYLLGAWTVVYETLLRPESIFPLFAFLQIGCTLAFLRARWQRSSSGRVVVTGAAAMLGAAFCTSLKPSWGFAAIVPAAVILGGLVLRGLPGKRLASGLAFVFGLALVGLWHKGVPPATGWIADKDSKTFLPATLFTVHADLISQTMHENAGRGLLDAEDIGFLAHLDRRLEESRMVVPRKYEVLGHDPDYLFYHSDTLARLPGDADTSAERRAGYLRAAYFDAVRAQPLGMLSKVARQIMLAHSDTRRSLHRAVVPWREHFESARGFPGVYRPPLLSEKLATGWQELFRRSTVLASQEPERREFLPSMPPWIHSLVLGPLVGLLTVAGVFVLPTGRWVFRNREELLPAARVFAVIVLTHLGMILTIALVHSFDIRRYLALLSPSQSLLLATGSVLLTVCVTAAWTARGNTASSSGNPHGSR